MKKALKRMAAAALVTLSVLRGGDAFAQNAVDGRVVDANGAPLVGVTVLIKGTQSGTATGANGSYSIKAREDQTLVFSYLGYTTVEEYVGKRTAINVKMTEEASQIGAVEIVNIGYGTTTRRDLTGSVAKADLVDYLVYSGRQELTEEILAQYEEDEDGFLWPHGKPEATPSP